MAGGAGEARGTSDACMLCGSGDSNEEKLISCKIVKGCDARARASCIASLPLSEMISRGIHPSAASSLYKGDEGWRATEFACPAHSEALEHVKAIVELRDLTKKKLQVVLIGDQNEYDNDKKKKIKAWIQTISDISDLKVDFKTKLPVQGKTETEDRTTIALCSHMNQKTKTRREACKKKGVLLLHVDLLEFYSDRDRSTHAMASSMAIDPPAPRESAPSTLQPTAQITSQPVQQLAPPNGGVDGSEGVSGSADQCSRSMEVDDGEKEEEGEDRIEEPIEEPIMEPIMEPITIPAGEWMKRVGSNVIFHDSKPRSNAPDCEDTSEAYQKDDSGEYGFFIGGKTIIRAKALESIVESFRKCKVPKINLEEDNLTSIMNSNNDSDNNDSDSDSDDSVNNDNDADTDTDIHKAIKRARRFIKKNGLEVPNNALHLMLVFDRIRLMEKDGEKLVDPDDYQAMLESRFLMNLALNAPADVHHSSNCEHHHSSNCESHNCGDEREASARKAFAVYKRKMLWCRRCPGKGCEKTIWTQPSCHFHSLKSHGKQSKQGKTKNRKTKDTINCRRLVDFLQMGMKGQEYQNLGECILGPKSDKFRVIRCDEDNDKDPITVMTINVQRGRYAAAKHCVASHRIRKLIAGNKSMDEEEQREQLNKYTKQTKMDSHTTFLVKGKVSAAAWKTAFLTPRDGDEGASPIQKVTSTLLHSGSSFVEDALASHNPKEMAQQTKIKQEKEALAKKAKEQEEKAKEQEEKAKEQAAKAKEQAAKEKTLAERTKALMEQQRLFEEKKRNFELHEGRSPDLRNVLQPTN